MPRVFLVRHAQASFGTDDYDRLSERGRPQSRWLGEYFAERGTSFARIVAGTLKRQRQTAEEMLGATGGRLRVASFNNIPHLERQDRRHAISYA
jgi:broad specificity phosphatase PhoE